jgi:hypothetical protein
MADTTISQLPRQIPQQGAIIPYSFGGNTFSTDLSALGLYSFYMKANCAAIDTNNMPNYNSDSLSPNALMTLPINNLDSMTLSQFNSYFNSSNNTISVPFDGFYHISAKVSGYVPSSPWSIRAFYFNFINANTNNSLEDFGHFNCTHSYSNTHFCFQPSFYYYLNANTPIQVKYRIYSNSGTTQAMYQPIYNSAYVCVVKIS